MSDIMEEWERRVVEIATVPDELISDHDRWMRYLVRKYRHRLTWWQRLTGTYSPSKLAMWEGEEMVRSFTAAIEAQPIVREQTFSTTCS